MRTKVQPERIFVGAHHLTNWAWCGILVNEPGHERWRCEHSHRRDTTAMRCALAERQRWIREGKGRS